jgi:hypothetical protein
VTVRTPFEHPASAACGPTPSQSRGIALTFARAVYGIALLLEPGPCQGGRTFGADDRASTIVGRALGARHLAQALMTRARPSRRALLRGAAVDGAHAISMVALAVLDPSRRRLGAFAAAISTGFTACGLRDAGAAKFSECRDRASKR